MFLILGYIFLTLLVSASFLFAPRLLAVALIWYVFGWIAGIIAAFAIVVIYFLALLAKNL